MKSHRSIVVVLCSALLVSCGNGDEGSRGVSKPHEGGVEIDPPAGGFRPIAGQTVYVPAYPTINVSNEPGKFKLAVTLSIRNADPRQSIVVTSVGYFGHNGKRLRDYVTKPIEVAPMAAVDFFVSERDTSGGVSASFLVDWLSEAPVVPPVVESVMIGAASNQGVSFTSRGVVVSDRMSPSKTEHDAR
jgi:Protein of unknown function (DUF3124)